MSQPASVTGQMRKVTTYCIVRVQVAENPSTAMKEHDDREKVCLDRAIQPDLNGTRGPGNRELCDAVQRCAPRGIQQQARSLSSQFERLARSWRHENLVGLRQHAMKCRVGRHRTEFSADFAPGRGRCTLAQVFLRALRKLAMGCCVLIITLVGQLFTLRRKIRIALGAPVNDWYDDTPEPSIWSVWSEKLRRWFRSGFPRAALLGLVFAEVTFAAVAVPSGQSFVAEHRRHVREAWEYVSSYRVLSDAEGLWCRATGQTVPATTH